MSVRWYDVLATLDEASGRRLKMSELARRVVLSPSRLTRLVERLEREGLVERLPDAADRRSFHASMTRAGLARLRMARRTRHEVVRDRFLDRLPPAELRRLARTWSRLLGDDAPAWVVEAARRPVS